MPNARRSIDFLSSLKPGVLRDVFDLTYAATVGFSWSSVLRTPIESARDLRTRFDLQQFFEASFLVYLESNDCLAAVTAGHVLKSMRRGEMADRRVQGFRICDRGPDDGESSGVPIRYDLSMKWSCYEDEDDPDCGAIVIPGFEATTIISGGTVSPITPEQIADPSDKFDAYLVLGFPVSARRTVTEHFEIDSGRISTQYGCPFMPVTISEHGQPEGQSRQRFCADMDSPDDPGLANIQGMSGGPIFGLRKRDDGKAIVSLVAIQSSWYKGKKQVFGEYAKPFIESVDRQLKRFFDENESPDE